MVVAVVVMVAAVVGMVPVLVMIPLVRSACSCVGGMDVMMLVVLYFCGSGARVNSGDCSHERGNGGCDVFEGL